MTIGILRLKEKKDTLMGFVKRHAIPVRILQGEPRVNGEIAAPGKDLEFYTLEADAALDLLVYT